MGTRTWRIARILLFFPPTLLASSLAWATPAADWLQQRSADDGAFRGETPLATDVQATAEALDALRSRGLQDTAVAAAGTAFLDAQTDRTTEELARRVRLHVARGTDPSAAVDRLVTHQNRDGGFGDRAGYTSTALDTAWGLRALTLGGLQDADPLTRAIDFLVDRQQPDGRWSDPGDAPVLYTTSLALRALTALRDRFELEAPIAAAHQYLLASRDAAGAIGTPYETAAAILAIAPGAESKTVYSNVVSSLRNRQQANGSWGDSVFATALAIQALALTEQPQPNPLLGSISLRLVDGETGLALEGVEVVLGGNSSASLLTDAEGAAEFTGLPAGSYSIEAAPNGYPPLQTDTTLAAGKDKSLGTIELIKSLTAVTASIQGTITDAATGDPVAGATVSLAGPENRSATTNAEGRFLLDRLVAGEYTVDVSASGYRSIGFPISLSAGTTHLLTRALEPAVGVTIGGQVTASSDGTPISGASVAVSGATTAGATTTADGTYALSGLPAGALTISVSQTGFESAIANVAARDGQRLEFSPALVPEGEPDPAPDSGAVQGIVVDAVTELPVGGATVALTVGGTTATVTTDASGAFLLTDVAAGDATASVSADGYRTAGLTLDTAAGVTIDLARIALTPASATAASATGVLVDSITNQELAGRTVEFQFEGHTGSATAASDGMFVFDAPAEIEGTLSVSPDGYVGVELPVTLEPGDNNLGQIRLRPEGVEDLLPDLIIAAVDTSGARGAAGLDFDGTVHVEIENVGAARTSTPFEISAFVDLDRNGAFGEGDTLLGSVAVSMPLADREQRSVSFNLVGPAPFRDAPVIFTVDSAKEVPESVETNNSANSGALECRVRPPSLSAFSPVLKWKWLPDAGDIDPTSDQVDHGPLVVPWMDTNSDGDLTEADVPAVVFTSYNQEIVRVIRGDTAEQIWARTEDDFPDFGKLRIEHRSFLAAGDVDGDGFAEIVTGDGDGKTVGLLEHTGSLKWRTVIPGSVRTGSPAIADLDADGSAEIIVGNAVLSASDGSVLWTYPHGVTRSGRGAGPASLAADVDLDGIQEVIISNAKLPPDVGGEGMVLLDSAGNVRWTNAEVRDGLAAIGDFDDDDFAEIVIAARNRLSVVNHDGSILWGPADIPGSGRGGPPTVADVDGDGEPEIGVADGSRFTVFETDGSVKWSVPANDGSSQITGSTVFDFDDDGAAELIYADQDKLRIFRGASGDELFRIENKSHTAQEMPIVADIDGDGGAELLLVGNSGNSEKNGIRAFEAETGEWAPTRPVWNQHSYHVTNINDDGSIPAEEPASWLAHNTYRLNRFVDRDVSVSPDLTASLLEIVDDGLGEPLSLRLRVGNGGAIASPSGLELQFFDGDPAAGGTQLGSSAVPPLEPGEWVDVESSDFAASELAAGELFAVADPDEALDECRENNNTDVTAAQAESLLGSVTVVTDAGEYAPGVPVTVNASATNDGTFAGQFRIGLRIEDGSGTVVADLGETDLGTLAPGASGTASATWITDDIVAGAYEAVASLYAADGSLADEARTGLALLAVAGGGNAASASSVPRSAVHGPDDTVVIDHLVRNLSPNAVLAGVRLTIVIEDPDGIERSGGTIFLGDLAPLGQRQRVSRHLLQDASEGTWRVRSLVSDAQGVVLAQDETEFDVAAGLLDVLTGEVAVAHTQRYVGQTQTCTETLVNESEAVQVDLRHVVLDRGRAVEVGVDSETVTLDAGETRVVGREIVTGAFEPGVHTCLLQVKVAGDWVNLDYADFQLDPPPIDIEGTLGIGDRGRLLVLLDPPAKSGQKAEDPHGPKGSPGPGDQRAWLEERLEAAGWSYTIVTGGDAFATELRGDGYAVVALFNEQVKIAEAAQQELVAAVEQDGIGLLVAGMHDRRNGRVEPALGLKSKGKQPHVDGLYLFDSEIATADSLDFAIDEKPLRLDLQGARSLGDYTAAPKGNGKGKGGKVPGPGLSVFEHGAGRSIDAGFDLLLQGTVAGGDNPYGELLLAALDHVHPDAIVPVAGHVWPLHLRLVNEGIATPGRVVIALPEGMSAVDPGAASIEDGVLVWPFTLDAGEAKELDAWLRLPAQPGPIELQALIQTGSMPDWLDHRTVTHTIQVQ